MALDIYETKQGDKVKCTEPEWGWPHHKEEALAHLTKGKVYTVSEIEIRSYHTKVYLKEYPGKEFNSVQFDNVVGEV